LVQFLARCRSNFLFLASQIKIKKIFGLYRRVYHWQSPPF